MAYEIISQNNNTTTLSDGTNTITVPSRVVLATGTTYEITEVNNSTATLEGSDGSVIRDVPCVAVLAGGGGGSSLPDQTGHSGEFLTTDGSAASWSNKPLINDTNQTAAVAVGEQNYYRASAGYFGTAVGGNADAAGNYSIAYGYNARATAERSIQIGTGTNNDAGSLKVATKDSLNNMANYTLLDRDGAIPTDRFTTTPSADGTYVPTLTISSGTPTRSWAAPSGGLPSQTGNSGKFLTTDGTDASWSDKPLVNKATAAGAICIASADNAASNGSIAIGSAASVLSSATGSIVLGQIAKAYNSASYSIAIGAKANTNATGTIQLCASSITALNSDANTFKVANANGNYEIMSADGTIPTDRLTKVNSTITLTAAGWSSNTQTVTVNGVTSTSVVLVAPDPSDTADYVSAGILCTAQSAGTLTFTCSTTPTNAITVNVVAL